VHLNNGAVAAAATCTYQDHSCPGRGRHSHTGASARLVCFTASEQQLSARAGRLPRLRMLAVLRGTPSLQGKEGAAPGVRELSKVTEQEG